MQSVQVVRQYRCRSPFQRFIRDTNISALLETCIEEGHEQTRMSETKPRYSGLFTRRKTQDHTRCSAATQTPGLTVVADADSRQPCTEPHDTRPVSDQFSARLVAKKEAETQESKSFFKIPRRKKATSLNKDGNATRPSLERQSSSEQTRHSFQFVRSPFEAMMRPTLSGRSSNASLVPSGGANGALVVASSSMAVQGSPRIDVTTPTDVRGMSRQPSTRSVVSFKSSQSTPVSDASNKKAENDADRIQSRGRSLTYGGTDTKRKTSTAKPSKFFSMGRLLREPEDVSLFRPLSRESSPVPTSGSPKRQQVEKPSLPSLPDRIEGESSHQFLARMDARMPRTLAASVLATSDDTFHLGCLRLYMQKFDFVNDPLDMALRKLLMDTHLPKETQQIDRVLNAFSERYQVCNPRLYDTQVTPYVLSFALIMLHTDRFNQNNKYKMTKAQFLKNTTSEHTEHVSSDVLEYFYDNIISTPFILVEDELEGLSSDRSGPSTPTEFSGGRIASNAILTGAQNPGTFGRKSFDLYPMIMEDKLDTLRPHLTPILEHNHTLAYTGTLPVINIAKLHRAFTHPATLQLVSARSRPEAFATDSSIQNPLDTDPGLVDIQITKIGILKKREQKKAGSKPVYREWGVMLTPSQLLLFKNVTWVKHYMHQARDHNMKSERLVLTPPVHNYAPDSYMPTSDTVAMYDSSASKKTTHFCFFGRGGQQTHLIASSEDEMNDWVAKINYAAAFQTAGVRIRGTMTTQSSDALKRHRRPTSSSTMSTLNGSIASQSDIVSARQNQLSSKIAEMETRLRAKDQQFTLLQQHGRNLCTLTPIQPRTRTSLITAAGSLSAKMSWVHMELVKIQCHRDILVKDLELETNPQATLFTTPVRPGTPPIVAVATKSSPSKNRIGNVVGSLMRQVSTDTMKRVNRQFSASEAKRLSNDTLASEELRQHSRKPSEIETDYLRNVDFSAEALDNMFVNSPVVTERSEATIPETDAAASVHVATGVAGLDPPKSRSLSSLKTNLTLSTRTGKANKVHTETADPELESVLSSPSSGQSSGHFILHGRKVSVVQTPTALLPISPPVFPEGLQARSASTSTVGSGGDVFLDACEQQCPPQADQTLLHPILD